MTIQLSSELAAVLQAEAARNNVAPQVLLETILQEHFATRPTGKLTPQDEWERRLIGAAVDYGVSLSNEAVSSEGIYDS